MGIFFPCYVRTFNSIHKKTECQLYQDVSLIDITIALLSGSRIETRRVQLFLRNTEVILFIFSQMCSYEWNLEWIIFTVQMKDMFNIKKYFDMKWKITFKLNLFLPSAKFRFAWKFCSATRCSCGVKLLSNIPS